MANSVGHGLSRPVYFLCSIAMISISVITLFHAQFANHFSVLLGDSYDGVIESVLVDHWFKVFQGLQAWNTPLYFYPHQDTLGYNDAYFLYGLITIPFRLAGVDIFRSQEYVHVCVRIIGFLSMAALLKEILGRRCLAGLFGASVFTLMLNVGLQAGHAQLLSLSFIPLLALMLMRTVAAVNAPGQRFSIYAALTLLLLDAMLLTNFYMAWFFVLFCLLTAGAFILSNLPDARDWLLGLKRHRTLAVLLAAIVGFAGFLPFVLAYGPKLLETHGHPYAAARYYTLSPVDIVNIGPNSMVWGWLFDMSAGLFPKLFRTGEFRVGFTPDILVALLVFGFFVFATGRIHLGRFLRALFLATILALLLPLVIRGISPWWVVFRIVPGASGVRVVARFWLFLGFPVSILLTVLVEHFLTVPKTRLAGIGVGLLILVSQVDLYPPVSLNVEKELARLDELPFPPARCDSFFVTSLVGPEHIADVGYGLYNDNVAAMLLANHLDMPTINGFATFNPKDWDFSAIPPTTYLSRVERYAQAYRLANLCGYDLGSHAWTLLDKNRLSLINVSP